jgi:hypothetical protein
MANQPGRAVQAAEQPSDFLLRQHDRQTFPSFRANNALNETNLFLEDFMIEK